MKILFAMLAVCVSLLAGPVVGEPFPALTLEDQFEKKHTVSKTDTVVMISFERGVSSTAHDYLNDKPGNFLSEHNARYISDISGMPGIISRMFALPKMRDYNYSLMLNRDDDFEKKFDKKEDKLTVYRLDGGTVTSVEFIDPANVDALFRK